MPLVDLNVLNSGDSVPGEVRAFLREACRRIERFRLNSGIHGFVPSDFERTYGVLRTLAVQRANDSERMDRKWRMSLAKSVAWPPCSFPGTEGVGIGKLPVHCYLMATLYNL
jgi:hypothetical protein